MSQNAKFGIILVTMAAVAIFADRLIDAWFNAIDRRDYRRRTNPQNIEKTIQEILELELQQMLAEENSKKNEELPRPGPDVRSFKKLNDETSSTLSNISKKISKHQKKNVPPRFGRNTSWPDWEV